MTSIFSLGLLRRAKQAELRSGGGVAHLLDQQNLGRAFPDAYRMYLDKS
jgi:hypothetical protein